MSSKCMAFLYLAHSLTKGVVVGPQGELLKEREVRPTLNEKLFPVHRPMDF